MDLLGKAKPLLWLLILLNIVVLLGQVWPQGAPPFARIVNIIFLALTLVVFLVRIPDKR